jgi:nitrate reductase NapE component
LENRLDKLSKMSSWTSIDFVNQELWPILSAGSVTLDWPELVVGGLVQAGGRWSGPSWCLDSSSASCIFLSTTKVAFLGSITFSQVLELKSVRNEFISSCSFLARLLVSGPGFVIFMLDGE